MEPSKVYFTNLRTNSKTNLLDKMERVVRRAGIANIDFQKQFVAIKIHFGEPGNLAYIRPNYAARMADIIRSLGGKPFLTDSNTLYSGGRSNAVDHLHSAMENGFNPISARCEVIIADGLKGTECREIEIDGEYCKAPKIGSAIADADIILSMTHFKGHEQTGFGGVLKNLGMGAASVAGKLELHSDAQPKVNEVRRVRTMRCPVPIRGRCAGFVEHVGNLELQNCRIYGSRTERETPFPRKFHHERIARMRLLEPQRRCDYSRPGNIGFLRSRRAGPSVCRLSQRGRHPRDQQPPRREAARRPFGTYRQVPPHAPGYEMGSSPRPCGETRPWNP